MTVTDPAAVELLSSVSRIVRTARTYAHLRNQQLGRAGLSLGILARLSDGPTRPGDLAAQLGVTPSAVSRASAQLVEGGWVQRTSDPHDARACSLAITSEGGHELARVRREQARLVSGVLEGWDDDKAHTLTSLLDEFGTALTTSVETGRAPVVPTTAPAATDPAPPAPHRPDSVVAASTTGSTTHPTTPTTHTKAYA